jgi:PilZ domain/AMIN domain
MSSIFSPVTESRRGFRVQAAVNLKVDLMLLERRSTPRYTVEGHHPVTLDSVVEGTVLNVSEVGLAIATPYKPVLNSIVRVSFHLPDNDSPCTARAQVVRAASSGQIGLKLLKPESFHTHFETWRRFSTEENIAICLAPEPQADTDIDAVAEPSPDRVGSPGLDLEQLRAAILRDAEPSNLLIFSWKGILAGVIACTLLAGTVWVWYGRTHQSDANVKTSSSRDAELTPVAMSTPTVTQSPLEAASRQSTTEVSPVSNTLENSQSGESNKPVVVPKHNDHRGVSHEQIVVNLNRFTPVKAKLLHNPDRIYFDLSPGTRPKLSERFTLGSGSRLVRRVRIGHAEDGHTRVVLDLRQQCDYQANISRMPPYKLIINIRAERNRGTS